MKISENWLREWINPKVNHETLCDQLTMAGLEVEKQEAVAPAFDQVVIGEVIECIQHPNADKLRVTKVNVGQQEPLQIVCGAANCRLGLKVVCAQIGAVLPGDFKIKAAKLRGEDSSGMLCSFKELGIDIDSDGIIELPENAPIGESIRDYLNLDDHLIEVAITPNRADCFSILGIARDLSAVNQMPLTEPTFKTASITLNDQIAVRVDAPEAAPRYLARCINNVNMNAKSPFWLTEKLRRCGIRAIDPIVDVTNYVLLELGQPMHAFDRDEIKGALQVRFNRPNESLQLLDGTEVTLKPNTLIISDDENPLAMAGIFGGLNSGVTKKTKYIILESAYFSPLAITGKAREYGLHTESSHRFERGVDPMLQQKAMERATQLIVEICGGEVGAITEKVAPEFLPQAATIFLRKAKIQSVLGIEVPDQTVHTILRHLGGEITARADGFEVKAPSWRFDWQIEADLIEEIARIYGYNNIPNSTLLAGLQILPHSEKQSSVMHFKRLLVDQGYQEAITYSFVDPNKQRVLCPDCDAILLPNPISTEMSAMRLSLWTGLLTTAQYNQNRQQTRLKLFETGLRFVPNEASEFQIRQERLFSGLMMGAAHAENWNNAKRALDFFDLKADVERLLAPVASCAKIEYQRSKHSALHPGQAATVLLNGAPIGDFGLLHPVVQKAFDLNQNVFLFELLLDPILDKAIPNITLPSRYPLNRRDLALIVDEAIEAQSLIFAIEKANLGIQNVILFDLYQGEHIEKGKKSIALALMMQDHDKTLDEAEIAQRVESCLQLLKTQFNATLR